MPVRISNLISVPFVILILMLAACGGQKGMEEIPLYSGAEPLAEEDGLIADAFKDSAEEMKKQVQQQYPDAEVEVELYTLPDGTTFSDVKAHYSSRMEEMGWQLSMEEDMGEMGGVVGWEKGMMGNQAFAVTYISDPLEGGAYLAVIQAYK